MVSILIWNRLSSETSRTEIITQNPSLKKLWKHYQKRLTSAHKEKGEAYAHLSVASEWLYSTIMGFLDILYKHDEGQARKIVHSDRFLYTTRILEFLIALVSQLPTRRFTNTLLVDVHLLSAIKQSPFYKSVIDDGEHRARVFLELVNLLDYYMQFPIDDFSGKQLNEDEARERLVAQYKKLRTTAYENFLEDTGFLAYSNLASLGKREILADHLQSITLQQLESFCEALNLRTQYPIESLPPPENKREFLLECIFARYEQKATIQQLCMSLETLPTEDTLFSQTLRLTEEEGGDGNTNVLPLPIPQMGLQYLSVTDFLMRAFQLERYESFYQIQQDIETTVQRLKPQTVIMNSAGNQEIKTKFNGSSKMAAKLSTPVAILEVTPPKVGSYDIVQETKEKPSHSFVKTTETTIIPAPGKVHAELVVEFEGQNAGYGVLSEWDALRPGEVVFLAELVTPAAARSASPLWEQTGIKHLRSAEVIKVLDERDRPIYKGSGQDNLFDIDEKDLDDFVDIDDNDFDGEGKSTKRGFRRRRKLHVYLDALQYAKDSGALHIYKDLNVILRRRPRENNFHKILENIKSLTLEGQGVSERAVPEWLVEVVLGFGNPSGASYVAMHENEKTKDWFADKVNYFDTFLDREHLEGSFPGRKVIVEKLEEEDDEGRDPNGDPLPPYVLPGYIEGYKGSSSRDGDAKLVTEPLKAVSTRAESVYGLAPKKHNKVRFTPRQVEALVRGVSPGLTVVIGPPGTGKTDVAVQAVANLYHNYPEERVLVVAHSNNALNHIFEKIVELDVEGRHIVRLGGGEEQLDERIRQQQGKGSKRQKQLLLVEAEGKPESGNAGADSGPGFGGSFSKYGCVERLEQTRDEVLGAVTRLAASVKTAGAGGYGEGSDTGLAFYEQEVKPRWDRYIEEVGKTMRENNKNGDQNNGSVEKVILGFPFATYFSESGEDEDEGRARIFWSLCGGFEQAEADDGDGNHLDSVRLKAQFQKWWSKVVEVEGTAVHAEKKQTKLKTKTNNMTLKPSKTVFGRALAVAERVYAQEIQARLFDVLREVRPFDVLRGTRVRADRLVHESARIVAVTATFAAMNRAELQQAGFQCNSIVVEEAAQLTELETILVLALGGQQSVRRVVLIGDDLQNAPVVQNSGLRQYGHLDQSLFGRLVRLGTPAIVLNAQGRARPEIVALYDWQYQVDGDGAIGGEGSSNDSTNNGNSSIIRGGSLEHLPRVLAAAELQRPNPGLLHSWQFINVEEGVESEPSKHFLQNVAEAEYAVALYQYLRLLGYPSHNVTILSAYYGQKKLIEEIVERRCCGGRGGGSNSSKSFVGEIFGRPGAVKTIDDYQGEQNDIVIVSLVRTKRVGYLRDPRRLTVALSRARQGLYVLGHGGLVRGQLARDEEIVRRMLERNVDDKLMVVTGEMYGSGSISTTKTQRKQKDREGVAIEGVEHLGQYVYEMANTRQAYLKSKREKEGR